MATRKTITSALLALALATAPLHAEAQQMAAPDPMIVGLGAVKGGCGKWLAAPQNSAADASYVSWVFGYLSGVNAFNWCRAHPLDPVSSAALAEVTELAKRHQGPQS